MRRWVMVGLGSRGRIFYIIIHDEQGVWAIEEYGVWRFTFVKRV